MFRTTVSWTLLLGWLCLSSAVASGADMDVVPGPYLGVAVTQTRFGGSREPDRLIVADGKSAGYKFIAGWRLSENFAVEASYIDFGDIDEEYGRGVGRRPYTFEADADGYDVFAVGMIPVPYVDLFAKAGYASVDSMACLDFGGCNRSSLFAETSSDNGFAYGAGVQFRLSKLSLRAEYEKFDSDQMGDLDVISVGVTYTFDFFRRR